MAIVARPRSAGQLDELRDEGGRLRPATNDRAALRAAVAGLTARDQAPRRNRATAATTNESVCASHARRTTARTLSGNKVVMARSGRGR